jgi:hypothetical protein
MFRKSHCTFRLPFGCHSGWSKRFRESRKFELREHEAKILSYFHLERLPEPSATLVLKVCRPFLCLTTEAIEQVSSTLAARTQSNPSSYMHFSTIIPSPLRYSHKMVYGMPIRRFDNPVSAWLTSIAPPAQLSMWHVVRVEHCN